MFDFGDELTLESFRIPWLIWIQLLVLLLLMAFLFCFTFIASDPSQDTDAASASTIQSLTNHHSIAVINPLHNTPNQSIKGEITRSARCREIVREEGIAEREASSLYFLHPCYYYRLARVAFLKCLGLDSTSESSDDNSASTQKHRKKKKES